MSYFKVFKIILIYYYYVIYVITFIFLFFFFSSSVSVSGKGILSGHADGKVVRHFFDGESSGESQVLAARHSYWWISLEVQRALEQ